MKFARIRTRCEEEGNSSRLWWQDWMLIGALCVGAGHRVLPICPRRLSVGARERNREMWLSTHRMTGKAVVESH